MFLEELLAVDLRVKSLHTPISNSTQPFHCSDILCPNYRTVGYRRSLKRPVGIVPLTLTLTPASCSWCCFVPCPELSK